MTTTSLPATIQKDHSDILSKYDEIAAIRNRILRLSREGRTDEMIVSFLFFN